MLTLFDQLKMILKKTLAQQHGKIQISYGMLTDISPYSQGDDEIVVFAALGLGFARSGPAEIQKLVYGADALHAAHALAQAFVQLVDQERPRQ